MYVELNCKSNFSFLRGASDAREYILKADTHGMSAIGVCDINGVYGLPRAYEILKKNSSNLKLICGSQLTITDHPPITLIAQTRKAWGLLCRIITHLHAGKIKGEGQISLDEINQICKSYPGHEELTCLAPSNEICNFNALKNIFKDKIYLLICRYLDGLDSKRTKKALELSSTFNLPLVATNDVHYHDKERRALQDCLTCIREGVNLDEAGFKLFANDERYLKSPQQMNILFKDLPEALNNTVKIAESCTFSLSQLKYSYPKESIPDGETTDSYLKRLVVQGANEKYKGKLTTEVKNQILKELDFFKKRGEQDYFLTMYDILKGARERKIVFQGRGSAASSVICYSLGITAVDPIKNHLLFDRFANDARKDPPDIDVDFEHERREEVIQDIYDRYGRDRAGMVAAVHTYRSASSYREICKVLGVEVGTLKAAAVKEKFEELAKNYSYRGCFIETLTRQMKDFPRHLGTHTGGFIITNNPLVETVPVEPAAMDGRTIVQWDKHDLETLGMMKIDILSIGFLTVIRKATEMIGIDWQNIPINDPKTYALIHTAETAGCFQIESRAQMNSLPHTKPNTTYEMAIQVALIRPSMSKGGMSRSYLKGRLDAKKGRPFRSGHKSMDKILGRTHGVAMFPDQIMQIAMDVCHWSSAEADLLRRSLGKERSAMSVETQGEKLYKAMVKNGIKESLANDIMKRTQGFASYGFPEAHASSYGSLAYKSAYLKAHFPAEYLCALINSQPMGFYSIDFLINEAKRNSGVQILPIHPLKSDWDAKMEGPKIIRLGFRNVKKINQDDVTEMLIERQKKMFTSIEDFISRTSFNKFVLNQLTISNTFECWGIDRRHSFWKSLEFKNLIGHKTIDSQLSLFDENTRLEDTPMIFKKMTNLEEALIDYRTLGYSLKGNLMKQLRIEIPSLPLTSSKTLKVMKRNMNIRIAGILLVDQRPPPAKGFGFLTLEDEFGTIDLVLRPQVYDTYNTVFKNSRFLIVTGRIQRIDDQIVIKADHITSFAPQKTIRSHQPHPRLMNRIEWSQ